MIMEKSKKTHLEIYKMRRYGRGFSKCRIKGQITLQVLCVSARLSHFSIWGAITDEAHRVENAGRWLDHKPSGICIMGSFGLTISSIRALLPRILTVKHLRSANRWHLLRVEPACGHSIAAHFLQMRWKQKLDKDMDLWFITVSLQCTSPRPEAFGETEVSFSPVEIDKKVLGA